MANWLDSKLFTLLEAGLDGLSLRNKVIADNIANVDTPNFKRSDVNFDKILQAALANKDSSSIQLRTTNPVHIPAVGLSAEGFMIQDNRTTFRNDGNNVDIDTEMAKLAENTLHYNALSTALSSHINLLRQVVRE